MKKITLFLSSMAIASAAMAVTPLAVNDLKKVEIEKPTPVKATVKPFEGKAALRAESVLFQGASIRKVAKKAPGLTVSYEEPLGLFAIGVSENFRGYVNFSMRKGPAYKPLTWVNTSVGATEYLWEYRALGEDGSATILESDVKNLEYAPVWSEWPAPTLYGIDAEDNIDTFTMGAVMDGDGEIADYNIIYAMGGGCEQPISQTEYEDFGMSTYLYGDNSTGFSTFTEMGYNVNGNGFDPSTGLNYLWTDKGNGMGLDNPVFFGYSNVFESPAAPYFMSKMWCWMDVKANKATTVTMSLYKLTDEGYISDELIASGTTSLQKTAETGPTSQMLAFDLYCLDEDGLETDDPIVIDSAFIAIMEVNKDDFDVFNAVTGDGAIWPASLSEDPYVPHAMINLEIDGKEAFSYCPFGYGIDQNTRLSVTDWLWMVDAVYPWMFVTDGQTSKAAPIEGGNVEFDISSYIDILYSGYTLPDDCDWIDLETAMVYNGDESQLLSIPVAALPEGVEGRSATLDIEYPAAKLQLTITQGEVNAVNTVVIEKDAQYFDLQGRRVANPEKGLYIKKTGNKAEKVIL